MIHMGPVASLVQFKHLGLGYLLWHEKGKRVRDSGEHHSCSSSFNAMFNTEYYYRREKFLLIDVALYSHHIAFSNHNGQYE